MEITISIPIIVRGFLKIIEHFFLSDILIGAVLTFVATMLGMRYQEEIDRRKTNKANSMKIVKTHHITFKQMEGILKVKKIDKQVHGDICKFFEIIYFDMFCMGKNEYELYKKAYDTLLEQKKDSDGMILCNKEYKDSINEIINFFHNMVR
jgi:hypothetical protein